MFCAAYTVRQSFRSEGIYVTTDGGFTWFGSDTTNGTPLTNHGGDPGPIIDRNGRFILTHQGNLITGMYSNYSDNLGITWSANYQIASGDQDKGAPATDDVASSTYYGRTYLVWTRYSSPFPIVISWTDNGAVSWTPPLQVNNSQGGHLSQGPYVSIGALGQVYVTWASTLQTSPFTEDCIGFASSVNGGANWSVQECAYDCNGIKTSQLAPWNIRVNGFPYMDVDRTGGSRHGWIYIVTAEKNLSPAGTDPDIVFHRSTNSGQTWSAGVRVNQDALNNGKVQYFPAIEVDSTGGINVVYYDNRDAPADTLMGLYLSRSVDGGSTWSDYRVNDHWFRPRAVSGSIGSGNQGDNIGIISALGKLWPVWMDNSTGPYPGLYQIWTAAIEIAAIGIQKIDSKLPGSFGLGQNYPNPFNLDSRFEVRSPKLTTARISIYDARGSIVRLLFDGQMKPGTYKIHFDGSNFPSGVYFYQLTTPEYSETKKMVLAK